MSRNRMARRRRWPLVVSALWLVLVAAGMAALAGYSAAPGAAATAPAAWPAQSRLAREPGAPTLVMLLHPLCPCSQASVAELERLMAKLQGRLRAHVLFVVPRGGDESWEGGRLRSRAAAIPGAQVLDDPDGAETRLFGGFTSGQTLLYDARDQLRFAGGITDARGHEGGNFGVDAVLDAVLADRRELATTPVFGCALTGPEAAAAGTGAPS